MGASCLREAAENINKLWYLATVTESVVAAVNKSENVKGLPVAGATRAGCGHCRVLPAAQRAAGMQSGEQSYHSSCHLPCSEHQRGNFRAGQSGASRWHCKVVQDKHPKHPGCISESWLHQLPALAGLRLLTDHRLFIVVILYTPCSLPRSTQPLLPSG